MNASQSGFPGPIGRAVLDSVGEGVAVFDRDGRLLYANPNARRALSENGNGDLRADQVREHLPELSARVVPLRVEGEDVGEAVFLPSANGAATLADQERRAILDTLHTTRGKLAEAARRLGISRTTLWRRLKVYGVDPRRAR